MLKLRDNPPILFPEQARIEDIDGPWWVARTKSRHEKTLAKFLAGVETAYFLPLVERVHRHKDRKYKCLVPLFPGYLFFAGPEELRYQALTSNRIAQVIEVGDQAGLVRDLCQVYEALDRGVPIDPHPYLKAGQRCRVAAGPLAGLEGLLVLKKDSARLVMQVDILGQACSVEVDVDNVEPLD